MAKPDVDTLNANPAVRQAGIAFHQVVSSLPRGWFLHPTPEQRAAVGAALDHLYSLIPRPTGNDSWEIDPQTGQLKYNTNRGQTAMKIAGISMLGLAGAGAGLALAGGAAAAGAGAGASAATAGGAGAGAAGAAGAGAGLGSSILGTLGTVAPALGTVGQIAGSIAGGRAAGRAAEAQYGLDRARMSHDFAGDDTRRLLATDILSNLKGSNILDSLSPEARQTLMARSASLRGTVNDPLGGIPAPPQSGMGDKILGILSGVGQFGGAIGGQIPGYRPSVPAPRPNPYSAQLTRNAPGVRF